MKTVRFTLVEIFLAMMVIGIGILSIMGLIPIAMKDHRNAANHSQSADAAEGLLQHP